MNTILRLFAAALAVALVVRTAFAAAPVLRHTTRTPAEAGVAVAAPAVGDTLRIDLFDDVSYTLAIVATPPAGIAGPSFIARDADGTASAIIKTSGGELRVTIDDFERQRLYTVRVRNGVAEITERDTSQADAGECDTCSGRTAGATPDAAPSKTPEATAPSKATAGAKSVATAGEDDFQLAPQKTVVDILVVFDQGAKAWAESASWDGGDTIEEFADYAVNKMNTVLENSQLLDMFSYRLVGVAEIDATYAKIDGTALGALKAGTGAFASVCAMRETSGADITALLVDRTAGNTSGIGYALTSTNGTAYTSFGAANNSCSVCDIKTVHSRYTLSHETGHNMGCGHSNTQGSNSGPESTTFPYSCGYHFTDTNGVRRHTVMAYHYDGSYAGAGYSDYLSIPYFSSPDITPDEYGVPLGIAGTNDNRQVLIHTHKGASTYRAHTMPYDWDVRFIGNDGKDITDGTYFTDTLYVTLTNSNPGATIYYTTDGSTPNKNSRQYVPGTHIPVMDTTVFTACAVTNGVALSMRTVTFNEGVVWSGEAGRNGDGAWANDESVLAWNGATKSFAYSRWPSVAFPDLAGNAAPTVTVRGAVAPYRSAFTAWNTSYTFAKGDDAAIVTLADACFAPRGDLTFDVPVKLDAVAFTNPANHTLAFNAPFGQTVNETSGYCTNMIGIGAYGTLTVSPGAGKTQVFDTFNNVGWYYNNAHFRVGEGTVVFKGPVNGANGLFGSTQLEVDECGTLAFDIPGVKVNCQNPSGCGTVRFGTALPHESSGWTSSSWKGTLIFEGLTGDATTKDFRFDVCGNAESRVLLKNCEVFYLKNNNATFPGTLVLEGDGALRLGDNGYSNNWNVFGALEGDGAISASSQHTQTYVFNTATNYTGSIAIAATGGNGRRIVFGSVSSADDIPSQSATITIKSGAEASIGSNATWYAWHGVDIAGTLRVKGAISTLDCGESAATGLKLSDGATLRFDAADAKLTLAKAPAFPSGTVYVVFGEDIAPFGGKTLVAWPSGGTNGVAGAFAFASSSLASNWDLCKTADGLVVKPKERFDVPGTEVYLTDDAALEYWLDDQNFWMYEDNNPGATWRDFLEEAGDNGYLNWVNYLLGLRTDDADAKVLAKIAFDTEGRVVVSVVDALSGAPDVPAVAVVCTLYSTDDLGDWPAAGEAMDGASIAIPRDGAKRFYRVGVSFAEKQTEAAP